MSSVDLLIKVLADTSSANASFAGLSSNITKALGAGAAGGAAVAVTQAAVEYQSAMATIQQAYNNPDFAPGTQRYSDAKDQLLKDSVELATSFKDLTDVYSQGARFVDDFGNKLPTDKVNEYVDTMVRLSKVSTDALAPTDIGQRVDVFEKLFGQTNFKEVGSAVSAESGIHNQGEGPMLDTAISIAQYGASMGVSQAQALGIGNYLTDLKAGGQQGGASIGRMLLRMDTSADSVLDPQARYADEKKNRTAQEHLDDLQTSLKEAELKRSEMYGQHGLKTAYRKNPEAVMAEDDRIAKLKRDIADSQLDIAHENDPERSTPRGKMNLTEMAKTAGQDPTDFANLFKENPMEALLDFTRGLHELPEAARAAAETKAGIVNVRDQKTINTLSDRPDVATDYVAKAQAQLDNPTDLTSRSDIALSTTKAKEADVVNAATGAAATVGEPARDLLDKGLSDILTGIRNEGFTPLEHALQTVAEKFDVLQFGLGALQPLMAFFGAASPAILARLMGAAGTGAAAAGGGAAEVTGAGGAAAAGGLAAIATGTAGALVAGGIGFVKIDEMKQQIDSLNNARTMVGLPPITMNFGDIHPGQDSAEQIFEKIKGQFVSAWNAAMNGTPVSGAMGGAP